MRNCEFILLENGKIKLITNDNLINNIKIRQTITIDKLKKLLNKAEPFNKDKNVNFPRFESSVEDNKKSEFETFSYVLSRIDYKGKIEQVQINVIVNHKNKDNDSYPILLSLHEMGDKNKKIREAKVKETLSEVERKTGLTNLKTDMFPKTEIKKREQLPSGYKEHHKEKISKIKKYSGLTAVALAGAVIVFTNINNYPVQKVRTEIGRNVNMDEFDPQMTIEEIYKYMEEKGITGEEIKNYFTNKYEGKTMIMERLGNSFPEIFEESKSK